MRWPVCSVFILFMAPSVALACSVKGGTPTCPSGQQFDYVACECSANSQTPQPKISAPTPARPAPVTSPWLVKLGFADAAKCATPIDCTAARGPCGELVAINSASADAFTAKARAAGTAINCEPPVPTKPEPVGLCREGVCVLGYSEGAR